MLKFIKAELRPAIDDLLFSSLIILHLAAPPAGRVPVAAPSHGWRARLGALGAALFLFGCQAEPGPTPQIERLVQVQQVRFETAGASGEFVGVVRARYETDLAF